MVCVLVTFPCVIFFVLLYDRHILQGGTLATRLNKFDVLLSTVLTVSLFEVSLVFLNHDGH